MQSAPALRVAMLAPASYVGIAAIRSGSFFATASSSEAAFSGLAAFHASKVLVHSSYLSPRAALWPAKNSYVSGETYHLSSAGRPSASRAESAYLTPASPCAAHVPAISSMPLPMMVLHTISVGLPLFESLA